MLCARLVAVLTFSDGVLTRTKRFKPDYRYTDRQISTWLADEIVALDITRGDGRKSFLRALDRLTGECFAPLTVGGGIRSLEEVRMFMSAGADKIAINTAALERPGLISDIAGKYGTQAVVVSIDARNGEVYGRQGTIPTGRTAVAWARECESLGAGELLVTSIDRDGSLSGYDLDLCRSVAGAVGIPVVFHGGAGSWGHFHDGIAAGASAVATQNIYHFTETAMIAAKAFLRDKGVPVRL